MYLVQFLIDGGGDGLGPDLATFVRVDELGSCLIFFGEILDLVLRLSDVILFREKIQ